MPSDEVIQLPADTNLADESTGDEEERGEHGLDPLQRLFERSDLWVIAGGFS